MDWAQYINDIPGLEPYPLYSSRGTRGYTLRLPQEPSLHGTCLVFYRQYIYVVSGSFIHVVEG